MTQEEILQLQSDHQKSGLSLKLYLQQIGTCYSTNNYWRKKYCCAEVSSAHDLGSDREKVIAVSILQKYGNSF